MIRHLLKLAWNRKRSNALVIVEVFAAFLVLFVVGTGVAHVAGNAKVPLGYEWRDVWSVTCNPVRLDTPEEMAAYVASMDRLVREARALPGVRAATAVFSVPYDDSRYEMGFEPDGKRLQVEFLDVGDEFASSTNPRSSESPRFK